MTSHGRRPQKLKLKISQQPLVGSYPNLKLEIRGPHQMSWKNEGNILWKTTSHGRWPQKWKEGVSQEHLVWTFANLKLRLREPSQMLWKLKMKMTSHGKRPHKWKWGKPRQQLVQSYPDLKPRLMGNISTTTGLIWIFKKKLAVFSRLTASSWGWAQLIPACFI
jgi:hypothetical protein